MFYVCYDKVDNIFSSLIIFMEFLILFLGFLAALSSSRSIVVGPSVRPSVRDVCEKVTFRVSKGN